MSRRLLVATAMVALAGVAHADSGDARIERTDGSVTRGSLLMIDSDALTITTADGPVKLPLADVRRVVVDQTAKAAPAPTVKVLLVDGGELSGTDVTQADGTLAIVSTDGAINVPTERVKRITWTGPDGAEPTWISGLPPEPASDLLVVTREAGQEFVECAVTGLGADTVSVVLDGDTIPVKRAKVAGIVWLREQAPPAGGVVVIVRGGRVQASTVRWSPEGFVIDDGIRMPAASLRSIDFAAGRTVLLASLEPERVDFEPFFGGLRDVTGLAAFLEPRTITPPTDDGPSTLLVRPRSVLTYRVPPDSRRFRARIERDVPATATAQVEAVVTVDDNEVVRRRIDAATAANPITIDADVTGGRRITLTIDFVPDDVGCALRISGAAFEK